jgi:hypothetical protein
MKGTNRAGALQQASQILEVFAVFFGLFVEEVKQRQSPHGPRLHRRIHCPLALPSPTPTSCPDSRAAILGNWLTKTLSGLAYVGLSERCPGRQLPRRLSAPSKTPSRVDQ